jgi:hypothetical protein
MPQRCVVKLEREVANEVSAPAKAAAGMLCAPHRERTGRDVPADVVVTGGTPMCRECFRGQAIRRIEERTILPHARKAPARAPLAASSDVVAGRAETASRNFRAPTASVTR